MALQAHLLILLIISSALLVISEVDFTFPNETDQLLSISDGLGDAAPVNGHDDDCVHGHCGWAFQDAFCTHAKPKDKRYRIHSFAVVHGELYIFAGMAEFRLPLGHPPFAVSKPFIMSQLSNQLPNNLYRNYRVVAYNHATLGIEIDADWQVFFVAAILLDIPVCCSRIWHTLQVIRNRKLTYQPPPGTGYPLAFNAFFGNGAWRIGNAVYSADRIISGSRWFFHVQQRIFADNSTTYYRIRRFSQLEGLNFKTLDYMVYPVDGNLDYKTTPPKEFYLETVDHLVDRLKKSAPLIEQTLGDLPVFLLKNGYIFEDTLYLAKLDFIEIYNLTYPLGKDNGAQIQLTWSKDIPSEQMLTCRLWDSENSQYEETVYMGLFYTLAAIFMAVLVTQRKTKDKGHKFALSPNSLTLVELSDDAIFNK